MVIGSKYGLYVVTEDCGTSDDSHYRRYVKCLCACGNEKRVRLDSLKCGAILSCGCYHKSRVSETMTIHGYAGTKIYATWLSMNQRCNNSNSSSYPRYGGRGIKVCARWRVFNNFLKDMGEKPKGLTIERINGNKGYSPKNCKWAAYSEQNHNLSTNKYLTFKGKTEIFSYWAKQYKISHSTLWRRIYRNNWPIERALTFPIQKQFSTNHRQGA